MLKRLLEGLKDRAIALWNHLDPKLKFTVLSGAVTYIATRYGINLDPTASGIVSFVVGSVTGYRVPNDATLLKQVHRPGNPTVPDGVDIEAPPPGAPPEQPSA